MARKPLRSTQYRLKRKFGIRECKVILERKNIQLVNKQLIEQANERKSQEKVNTLPQCRIILERIEDTPKTKNPSSNSFDKSPIPLRLPWMRTRVRYTKSNFAI